MTDSAPSKPTTLDGKQNSHTGTHSAAVTVREKITEKIAEGIKNGRFADERMYVDALRLMAIRFSEPPDVLTNAHKIVSPSRPLSRFQAKLVAITLGIICSKHNGEWQGFESMTKLEVRRHNQALQEGRAPTGSQFIQYSNNTILPEHINLSQIAEDILTQLRRARLPTTPGEPPPHKSNGTIVAAAAPDAAAPPLPQPSVPNANAPAEGTPFSTQPPTAPGTITITVTKRGTRDPKPGRRSSGRTRPLGSGVPAVEIGVSELFDTKELIKLRSKNATTADFISIAMTKLIGPGRRFKSKAIFDQLLQYMADECDQSAETLTSYGREPLSGIERDIMAVMLDLTTIDHQLFMELVKRQWAALPDTFEKKPPPGGKSLHESVLTMTAMADKLNGYTAIEEPVKGHPVPPEERKSLTVIGAIQLANEGRLVGAEIMPRNEAMRILGRKSKKEKVKKAVKIEESEEPPVQANAELKLPEGISAADMDDDPVEIPVHSKAIANRNAVLNHLMPKGKAREPLYGAALLAHMQEVNAPTAQAFFRSLHTASGLSLSDFAELFGLQETQMALLLTEQGHALRDATIDTLATALDIREETAQKQLRSYIRGAQRAEAAGVTAISNSEGSQSPAVALFDLLCNRHDLRTYDELANLIARSLPQHFPQRGALKQTLLDIADEERRAIPMPGFAAAVARFAYPEETQSIERGQCTRMLNTALENLKAPKQIDMGKLPPGAGIGLEF